MVGVVLLIMSEVEVPNPYHPYPIIFVHGYNAHPGTWGVKVDSVGGNPTDSIKGIEDHNKPFAYFLDHFMMPYILANPWNSEDSTGFYQDTNKGFPNRDLLEVLAVEWGGLGSVDEDAGGPPYPCSAQDGYVWDLYYKVLRTLEEYYGPNWRENPDAKVVIVAHSMGGLITRWMLTLMADGEVEDIRDHIAKVVTIDTPHPLTVLGPDIYTIRTVEVAHA